MAMSRGSDARAAVRGGTAAHKRGTTAHVRATAGGSSGGAWRPVMAAGGGPIYLAIVDTIAADVKAGRLAAGTRLPTHRALAAALDVNLTTVTRAYGEARRRGLIEGGAGRGTFVAAHGNGTRGGSDAPLPAEATVDMTMNLPPLPAAAELSSRLAEGLAAVLGRADLRALMTYGGPAGREEERRAGAAWLGPRWPGIAPERVIVTAGAQAALLVLLTSHARTGDTILTEALTFPGFMALARHFGVRLEGVAMDAEGIVPEALEAACRRTYGGGRAKGLYLVPTIHNPTTATMGRARRKAVAAVARAHGVPVFEDDACGALPAQPLPPVASFAPEVGFYVAGVSKCLAPALRVAFLVAPDAAAAARLAAAVRATTGMAPAQMTALVAQWIGDGTADAIVGAIRAEAAARQAIARAVLPPDSFAAHPEGHHVWLRLPAAWGRHAFEAHLRQAGLAVVPSDAFAVAQPAPDAVRIALGAAADRAQLRRALTTVAGALAQPAAIPAAVV